MVLTQIHAKNQDQRSVRSKNRVATDGETDKGNCITSRANVVGNDTGSNLAQSMREAVYYSVTKCPRHLITIYNITRIWLPAPVTVPVQTTVML